MSTSLPSTTADVVRRYYAVAGDLSAPEGDLAALLDPEVRIVEHPNAVTPDGAVRGREETLAGFRAGRGLLRDQEFVVHELVVDGDRAAVRAHWRATIGTTRGPLTEGTRLEASIASFLTIADGRIVDQETFDCYAPFA